MTALSLLLKTNRYGVFVPKCNFRFSLLLSKHIGSADNILHLLKANTVKMLRNFATNICFDFLMETDTIRVKTEDNTYAVSSIKIKELQSEVWKRSDEC